ncbi:hypothetical protein TorRG33x02_233060 [Trema orientale]|uniref:Uncharacterized protein n=1 Tax=Trema orientale TaxID=63057 RepID=A0A2P5E5T8_TREOI|nr:hypothetical protein TorRG33x02_233060 [Trema orientale]
MQHKAELAGGFDQYRVDERNNPCVTALHPSIKRHGLFKIRSAQMGVGVVLKHGCENMDVGPRHGVEDETGVRRRRVVARAAGDEQRAPAVEVVERVCDELRMELSEVAQIADFGRNAVHA